MNINTKFSKYFPSNKHVTLTKEGLDDLKSRLDYLRNERFTICKKLINMDAKEKAEYIAANDEIKVLEMNDEELTKISNILQNATTVENSSKADDVHLGSTVILRFCNRIYRYTLVTPIEADPSANKISEESPLGRKLLGRKAHEKVKIVSPRGKRYGYEVLSVV